MHGLPSMKNMRFRPEIRRFFKVSAHNSAHGKQFSHFVFTSDKFSGPLFFFDDMPPTGWLRWSGGVLRLAGRLRFDQTTRCGRRTRGNCLRRPDRCGGRSLDKGWSAVAFFPEEYNGHRENYADSDDEPQFGIVLHFQALLKQDRMCRQATMPGTKSFIQPSINAPA